MRVSQPLGIAMLAGIAGLCGLGIGPCDGAAERADLNLDGYVDDADLAFVRDCLRPPLKIDCEHADATRDGVVDGKDLAFVRRRSGEITFDPAWPRFEPASIHLAQEDTLYLHAPEADRIYRWSIRQGKQLQPLEIAAASTHLAHSQEANALYVAYRDGEITEIDTEYPAEELHFATLRAEPDALQVLGSFLHAVDRTHRSDNVHSVFDSEGLLRDRIGPITNWSREYAWSPIHERIYYLRDGTSPNDLLWMGMDPVRGILHGGKQSPYHGDFEIAPPIRLARDGSLVLLGSGDLYDAATLEIRGSIPIDVHDALWLDGGELLTLRAAPGGAGTLVEHWDPRQRLHDVKHYPGAPLRVLEASPGIVVVTHLDGRPTPALHLPTGDGDGDGIPTVTDAFPLDAAASSDLDGDGYPDAWNPGSGAEDSAEGLELDAFPEDSACWRAEDARPDAPDVCDIAGAIPAYHPARIVADDSGVLYLFSPETERIYRWSVPDAAPLNPIHTQAAPLRVAGSRENDRLYVGYESGAIRQIDLTAAFPREKSFAAAPHEVAWLDGAGPYVFVADRNPTSSALSHYTYAPTGEQVSDIDTGYQVYDSEWSEPAERLYYIEDYNKAPYSLRWYDLDLATGRLASSGGGGRGDLDSPLRISADGSRILIGPRSIRDLGAGGRSDELPIETALIDALWLDEGELLTLRPANDGGSLVEQWGPDLRLYQVMRYDGAPLRIAKSSGRIAVVTHADGRPSFTVHSPSVDADGDGVANALDAFPRDPAASRDRDADGHPDAWNPGMGPEDSTQGLDLDAFPDDAICWLEEHARDDDPQLCDIARAVPSYLPDQVIGDGSGVFYLLSSAHDRIFRWSLESEYHLAPIEVGDAPRGMAHSEANDRLYVAYATGAIRQVDLAAPLPSEMDFAFVASARPEVQTADPFVFVVDRDGSRSTYRTFDPDGSPISDLAGGIPSEETVWSPSSARMLLLTDPRPGYSSEFSWASVDPASGEITGKGPIVRKVLSRRLWASPDGETLLFDSGDLHDAGTLDLDRSLPVEFVSALWLEDGGQLTLRNDGEGGSRLENWGPQGRLRDLRRFEGKALHVVASGDRFVAITEMEGQPAFFPYVSSVDADGDGVENEDDAFPLDPAASRDSDADGHPDAWNESAGPADSVDGLTLDAFPQDSACWLHEQALPEDPTRCDIAGVVPAYEAEQVTIDPSGVVYLLSDRNGWIYRWSSASGEHLNPIPIGRDATQMVYSVQNDRLYVAYGNGALRQVDASLRSPREMPFAAVEWEPVELEAVGRFVAVVNSERYGNDGVYHLFSPEGLRLERSERRGVWTDLAWSATDDRLYYFDDDWLGDLRWRQIDPETGEVTAEGGPFDRGFHPPVWVSPDGAELLLSSGAVLSGGSLASLDSLPRGFEDAYWMDDGSLLLFWPDAAGGSRLERWGAAHDRRLIDVRHYEGEPRRVMGSMAGVVVVTQREGRPHVAAYLPTEDSDDDGVPNADDAFPLDPAASSDRDGDGHPDAWNPGMDATDSSSGLSLDAFPDEDDCWLEAHTLPGHPGTCDFAHAVPAYVPERVVADEDGVLYLLAPEHRRVFRWSAAERRHLEPIDIGEEALDLAWSGENRRLYASHAGGEIRQIDPSETDPQESPFAATRETSYGLQTAGRFVFTTDPSSWWTHSLFAADGSLASVKTDVRNSHSAPTWDPALERMYFFEGGSPDLLAWDSIDARTGSLGAHHEETATYRYWRKPPIRVTPDGSKLLLGTGVVYETTSFEVIGAIPILLDDARWLDDGSLVTLRSAGNGRSLLEHWGPDLRLLGYQRYEGSPLGVLDAGGELVVVTLLDGAPAFVVHSATDDPDGDGTPSPEDAFPFDPAASQDSDGDGFPDAWNPGRGPGDSTDLLTLDAFPLDAACWLPEDGLPEGGGCDIVGATPRYRPSRVLLGRSGVVHLLHPATERVYRWSLAADAPLNPIPLEAGPRAMAYSAENDRIYVGYDSGSIEQLDPSLDAPKGAPFAVTPRAVSGLETAGTIVFAVDWASQYSSSYTFLPDGAQVATGSGSDRYVIPFTWNAAAERMHFVASFGNSNALSWMGIDPVTGVYTESGRAPYSQEPREAYASIDVSPDGDLWLTRSGNVFDALDGGYVDSLPGPVQDGLWRNYELFTIRWDGDDTLFEQWSRDLRLHARTRVPGAPLRLLAWDGSLHVVTEIAGRPAFHSFPENDDGDGDGVPNADDDLPLDPAASVDSDGDGSPDAWNPGSGPDDSPHGLALDAFPDDPACQLPEHGRDGACDFSFSLPSSSEQVICDSDAIVPVPGFGMLDPKDVVGDLLPLCDGWLLMSATQRRQIEAINVYDGRVGARFQLPSEPTALALDAESKLVYVALPEQQAVGRLDLVTGELSVIAAGPVRELELGPRGGVFVAMEGNELYWLEPGSEILEGGWPIAGTPLRHNPVYGELLAASPRDAATLLSRYSADPPLPPAVLQSLPGNGNVRAIALSPDGEHLAVSCSTGAGCEVGLSDHDSGDLDVVRGFWHADEEPHGAAFDSASERLLVSTTAGMTLYDVAGHHAIDDLVASDCIRADSGIVAFSRGDRIALASLVCNYGRESRLYWFATGE